MLSSREGDIDAVAHQIAVGLFDYVAEVNADAELDAPFRRQAGVALDRAALHFDRAAHRVDHAAELDENAVAGALDDAPMMNRDDGVDEIAAKRPQAHEDAILVCCPQAGCGRRPPQARIAASFRVSPIWRPSATGVSRSPAKGAEPSKSSSHKLIPYSKISK